MNSLFLFPGSFSPPTYGHLEILKKAAKAVGKVTVICSQNASKVNWFSQETCKALWQSYDLPKGTEIKTLEEILKEKTDFSKIVMIRGIRNSEDLTNEAQVMEFNQHNFGIGSYLYFLAENDFADFSSTKAREAAEKLDLSTLAKVVSPQVANALLEKVLGVDNLFLVVGRPGGGKSTFLTALCEQDESCLEINTDEISKSLRTLIEANYPNEDPVDVAQSKSKELADLLALPWLSELSERLRNTKGKKHIFVEVPYGLCEANRLYRYLGAKVIYVGCSEKENLQRVLSRNPIHRFLIEKIPNLEESTEIAKREHLLLLNIDTTGEITKTIAAAKRFSKALAERKTDEYRIV